MAALVLAGCVLAADLVSKAWALRQLPSDSSTSTAIVQLRHVTNRGASFGLGAQHPFVVVPALVATLAVGWWLAKADSAGERVAVGVVLGGALGNLIDRLANGAVTDWAGITWYPATFNLADVAIRGGAVAALVMREVHRRRTHLGRGRVAVTGRVGRPCPRRDLHSGAGPCSTNLPVVEATRHTPGFRTAPRSPRNIHRTWRTQ